MQTDNIKPKISISEIAKTLGWSYTTVNSIINRKSPTDKLKIILECKEKLTEAKMAETVARFCFINPDTTKEDIEMILNTMN